MPTAVRYSLPLSIALMTACDTDPVGGPGVPAALRLIAGGTEASGRVILESADRFDTVTVRVVDAQERPMPGVEVSWMTDDPDGAITPIDVVSNTGGLVRAEWRLSGAPGTWKARATRENALEIEASFTVTSWSVKHAVVVGSHTCVQAHDDRLWCRTSDTAPLVLQFGGAAIRALDGSEGFRFADRKVCVVDDAGTIRCAAAQSGPLAFATIPGQSTAFESLALGVATNSYCALDEHGRAWCWGSQEDGVLGDGTSQSGFREEVGPVTVPGSVEFTALAINGQNGCAVDAQGTPWCWGRSFNGVTGPSAGPNPALPRLVEVQAPLVTISMADFGGTVCGLTLDRRAVCWGNPIGDGSGGSDPAPRILSGVADAIDLVGMPDGFIALRQKGELAGWGVFYFGHEGGPGLPGPLLRARAIRARAISPGFGLEGRTCFDDAGGHGTVCAKTRGIMGTQFSLPLLWIGLVPP